MYYFVNFVLISELLHMVVDELMYCRPASVSVLSFL